MTTESERHIAQLAIARHLAVKEYVRTDKQTHAVRYERQIKMQKAGVELENAIEAHLKGQP